MRFLTRLLLSGSLLLQLIAPGFQVHAAPGDVDLSFDCGQGGLDGAVSFLALQPDGKLIIGGGFTAVRGLARAGMARLNPDGSGDATFQVDPNAGLGSLRCGVLQPDGKLLVGGDFGVARLNSDGTVDQSFARGLVLDDDLLQVPVLTMALQPDGKVLIGGYFTIVKGTLVQGIARLNADGSLDGFQAGPFSGFFPVVDLIAVQPDGKVLVGGSFVGINGTDRSGIARLDSSGNVDGSFNPGAGTGDFSQVTCVALQPDGRILIGGNFNAFDGVPRPRIARLNANESIDNTFNPGTGAGGGDGVLAIVLQVDGKMIVGGSFTRMDGMNRNGLARLHADGSVDSTFDPGPDQRSDVFVLAVQADGKVLASGSGPEGSGADSFLTRCHADGSVDSTFLTRKEFCAPVSSGCSRMAKCSSSALTLPMMVEPSAESAGFIPTAFWIRASFQILFRSGLLARAGLFSPWHCSRTGRCFSAANLVLSEAKIARASSG